MTSSPTNMDYKLKPLKTEDPPIDFDTYDNTIFERILKKELNPVILYEDDICIAVDHVKHRAPIHYLVFPRKKIARLTDVQEEDIPLLGHLLFVANKVAKEHGLQDGYRIVINDGLNADQHEYYLHVHLMGGCKGSKKYFIK